MSSKPLSRWRFPSKIDLAPSPWLILLLTGTCQPVLNDSKTHIGASPDSIDCSPAWQAKYTRVVVVVPSSSVKGNDGVGRQAPSTHLRGVVRACSPVHSLPHSWQVRSRNRL